MTKPLRKISEKELASMYKYKDDDMVYDIESLSNVFTASQIYPQAPEKYNKIVISILDDGYESKQNDSKEITPIIKSKADLDYIRKRIFEINHMLNPETPIQFEMLNHFHGDPSKPETLTPNVGLGTFMERYGISYFQNYDKNAEIDWHYYPTMETDEGLLQAMGDNQEPDVLPMKNLMNDGLNLEKNKQIQNHFDPDFNKNGNLGLRLGYNSQNYDMTMLAYVFDYLHEEGLTKYAPDDKSVDEQYPTLTLDAFKIRQFNNNLFEKYKNNMSQGLVHSEDNFNSQDNYSTGYAVRQQWLNTNRFIDVAKLNEKLAKVGLKRLSGVLGFPIIESNLLDESSSIIDDSPDPQTGEPVSALERLAELLAYNLSDAINTQRLFEQSLYQSNYKVKSNLLKQYPQLIYQQDKSTGKPFTSGFGNIRRDRMIADATSAKFIENVIAPYDALEDNDCISFMYPSEAKAKELGVKQSNVLEDSMQWAKDHNVADAFQPIYDYYKMYEGTNANPQLTTNNHPLTSDLDMSGMDNKYFYRDKNGNPTASLTVFTIGGIHGAEVKLDVLHDDIKQAEQTIAYQQELEQKFGSPEEAYAYKLDEINPETGKKYRLGESPIQMNDGTILTAKSLLKSNSTSKRAYWKNVKMPTLYDNVGIRDKYRYTSHGPAHHEDFSSYYPALLSNLQVFYDKKNHVDVYNQIYLGRLELKKQLKQTTDKLLWTELNEQQTAFKLLLNAASGAADPKNPQMKNKIRKNNAIVSMRIIGQLFSWRIGQAQALQGGRLPSVNTDGLYVMGIDAETNQRTLDNVIKPMLIKVDPEEVDRFVSKDTNNRLEVYTDGRDIVPKNVTDFAAKGGKLTSYNGPSTTNTLDHPAAIDHALGDYLAYVDNAVDKPFDRNIGAQALGSIFSEYSTDEALRFFQWIIASSPSTPRIAFKSQIRFNDDDTYETLDYQNIQRYNRVFLTKPHDNKHRTILKMASAAKPKSKKSAITDVVASQILAQANAMPNQNEEEPKLPKISKISGMPDLQNVTIDNRDILEIAQSNLINELDATAYLDMLENAFNTYAN